MRIGIDARFYGSLGKGLGRYTEKLLKYLEEEPGDHTYVVFLRRENFEEYQPKDTRFQKQLADFPWYGWQEQILFPWVIFRQKLDLMHFPHFNVPLLSRTPFIVTIHDLILLHFPTVKASELPPFLYWLKYLAYRFVIGMAIWRACSIVTVSEFTRKDIEETYPVAHGKISVTLEAAEPFCIWKTLEQEKAFLHSILWKERVKIPYILYVGNAYPHKNLDLLAETAKMMPEVLFLFVGKSDFFYRNFEERCRREAIENIVFLGYVPDEYLGVLYKHAALYVFPSLYEGFGLPGLEAMAYGIPVAAARAGSLPEIYGDAALYFDPRDAYDCARVVREVLNTPEKNRDRRARGWEYYERYSWSRMAKDTRFLYEKSML